MKGSVLRENLGCSSRRSGFSSKICFSSSKMLGRRGEALQGLMNYCVVVPVFLAMGFSLSFLGGVVRYVPFYSTFPQIDTATTTGALKSHNSLIQGTTVSSLNLGAAVGCLSCMYIGNKLGRRKTTFLGAIIALAGTVLQCSAFSLGQLVVSRGAYQYVGRFALTRSDSGLRTRNDVLDCASLAVGD